MWLSNKHFICRSWAALLVLGTALINIACVSSDDGFAEQTTEKKSFGEIVYGIFEYNVAQSDSCQAPLVEELREHRSDVIVSLDTSVPADLLAKIRHKLLLVVIIFN